MLQPGGEPDLAQEPLGAERGGELGVQHLERDLAVVLEVVREVDRGHAAAAELALERVAVGQGADRRSWMWFKRCLALRALSCYCPRQTVG